MIKWEKEEWMGEALCKEHPEVQYFPIRGENPQPAVDICRECPVIEECLDYSLRNKERWGILGGRTARERRLILRLGWTAAEAVDYPHVISEGNVKNVTSYQAKRGLNKRGRKISPS